MFEEFFIRSNIPAPRSPIPHNKFIRWGKNNRYSAIRLGDDGVYAEDFITGHKESWFAKSSTPISPEEAKKRKEIIAKAKHESSLLIQKQHNECAAGALNIWRNLSKDGSSPYLERKKVKAYGIRYDKASAIIPLYDTKGKIWNLQVIYSDGKKLFQKGCKKKGCFHAIGKLSESTSIFVCEGYATGASIYQATNITTIIAFDAGNFDSVIASIKSKYPKIKITIAADNDLWKTLNTGKVKATNAAKKYSCKYALPKFPNSLKATKPTDFNDLYILSGADEVKRQLCTNITGAKESDKDIIARLAALTPLEYERVRVKEAVEMKVRTSILDKQVLEARKLQQGGSMSGIFPNAKPWPKPVDAALLLDEIVNVINRFIICKPETATATALWCVFTWVVDHVQVAPLAVITAPEMRCGKSQLLNLIGQLSYRPLVASNISPSAVFRVIESHKPTLLIDEADTFFKENEELRGVINSGHTRQSAYVIRTVGENHEAKQFSTWGAKAISGIGSLADTIRDRAIILELRRKLSSESVDRMRHAEKGLFESITSKLSRFALDAGSKIAESTPASPDSLNDRAQDNWEPLFAIADYAGGRWPELARDTALKISGSEQEAVSRSVELLADIQEVFDTKRVERISTADLISALMEDDTKLWATYNRGKPISPRQLAVRLKDYQIKSKNIKLGYEVRKGFERQQFEDSFSRYLSMPLDTSEISATTLPDGSIQANLSDIAVAEPFYSSVSSAIANSDATTEEAEIRESSALTDKIGNPEEVVEVVL